jgi:hypothetical protein
MIGQCGLDVVQGWPKYGPEDQNQDTKLAQGPAKGAQKWSIRLTICYSYISKSRSVGAMVLGVVWLRSQTPAPVSHFPGSCRLLDTFHSDGFAWDSRNSQGQETTWRLRPVHRYRPAMTSLITDSWSYVYEDIAM